MTQVQGQVTQLQGLGISGQGLIKQHRTVTPFPRLLGAAAIFCVLALLALFGASSALRAQSTGGEVSGFVSDESGGGVPQCDVQLISVERGDISKTKTNDAGIYSFPNLKPGIYQVRVNRGGFKQVDILSIIVNVQSHIEQNVRLQVGSISESVTVTDGGSMINTTDASVSTVIDHTYMENMPLNGRSFQDLILLTPGVVTQTPQGAPGGGGLGQTGEFSVNGQRMESNYYTVDGVSANVGAAPGTHMTDGAAASGSLPGATALGTTQSLVSVDALQEFRVQSSTYSAEYGRNPGGQFAFETKSGTNQWHGTVFDYLRNDYFDANDWFSDYRGLKQAPLRQNDFGGTLGGPVRIPGFYNGTDKTFFFISYEGLRLLQPQAAGEIFVPSLCLRGQSSSCTGGETPAPGALQPILNAFPVPTGPEILQTNVPTGAAPFDASWSNPSSIDSTSVRFDRTVTDRLRLFFRFSDARSNSATRAPFGLPSSIQSVSTYGTRSYTAGINSMFSNNVNNELRFNYSSNYVTGHDAIDSFGNATPVSFLQLTGVASGAVYMLVGGNTMLLNLTDSSGAQRQWNVVNTLGFSMGRHQFKYGLDYRRLTPFAIPFNPFVDYFYFSNSAVEGNSPDFTEIGVQTPAYPLYMNFSAFAQDAWRLSQRLTISLGLRWEVNPPPSVTQGLSGYTIQGSDPISWKLAPQGTSLWHTAWFNFAPRMGTAYILRDAPGWSTVVRSGGGVFFDTGQQVGSTSYSGTGFSAYAFPPGPFPGTPAASVPTIDNPPSTPYNPDTTFGFAPHLQLPYTLQWNVSVEQEFGKDQALTGSYIGSHASRLLKQSIILTPTNPNGTTFRIWQNGLTADYESLQFQLRRKLAHGLTGLASYTWAHCTDYGSENYWLGYQHGNCDMDIRHNFSTAFSYGVPNVGHNALLEGIVHNWGLDGRFTARTGFPVTLNGIPTPIPGSNEQRFSGLDLVLNQPTYIYGAQCDSVYASLFNNSLGCPGGRAINPNAFAPVPTDPNTGNPTRLGTAPRNFARGFGAWQMDLAVRRDFPIHERLNLQFRTEVFNIFNHPNFGGINSSFGSSTFGQATGTLAQSLGILSPLYQMGGPRSMQFALKFVF